ncbi:hypothetical protein Ndes2437B_g07976 [Nannochloris sp. 'desiccata']
MINMLLATRCPVVALTAGTTRAKQASFAGVRSCHLSLRTPLAPILCPVRPVRKALRTIRPSRITVSANASVNYSADDLSSGNNGNKALVYRALAATLAVTGIALLVAPTRALQLTFVAYPTTLISGLTQALGSIHILAAIAANCLSEAASHARLPSETYKRLNLGLVTWGAATLAAYYKVSSVSKAAIVLVPNAHIAFYALYTATSFLPVILAGKAGLFAPMPPAPRMRPLFTAQRLYSLAATAVAIFAIAVGYDFYRPGVVNVSWLAAPLGSLGSTLVTFLGCGALLAYQVLVTLEDAARRGRLGASTFKALNWGVALLSGTIMALAETGVKTNVIKLWPAMPQTAAEFSARWPDVFSEFALGVSVILGCFSLYNAIAAKKK